MKAQLLLFDKHDRIFFEFPLEADGMEDMLPALYLQLYNNNQIHAKWQHASYFHILSLAGPGAQPKPVTQQSTLDFISHCKHYALTAAEINVAVQLRTGLPYKEMGKALNCSFNTVNTHATHIYDKLRVKNRHAAVKKLEAELPVI